MDIEFILCFILVVLVCLVSKLIGDELLFRKFKVGYNIELFNIEYISLDLYRPTSKYKIIARKNQYICCEDPDGKIKEFNLYKLVSTVDRIEITDENGYVADIIYKIEDL